VREEIEKREVAIKRDVGEVKLLVDNTIRGGREEGEEQLRQTREQPLQNNLRQRIWDQST
jgi:hypothetical protein